MWSNVFYRFILRFIVFFFSYMAELIWTENHKLAERSLWHSAQQYNRRMLKKEWDVKWLHVYTVAVLHNKPCLKYSSKGWWMVCTYSTWNMKRIGSTCPRGSRNLSSLFLDCLQGWLVAVVLVLWSCPEWGYCVHIICVCVYVRVSWHKLNISIQPAWCWKATEDKGEAGGERKHFSS